MNLTVSKMSCHIVDLVKISYCVDPDQNIRTEVNNTDTPYTNTMFYYGKTEGIIAGMDLAIQKINLTLGRGFGEYIQWVKYEKALEQAKEQNMPIMLIIHRQWCSACKALKPIIAESRPIWKLSYYFIMVNVEDDEEPLDTQYFRDGGYYPRVFFLSKFHLSSVKHTKSKGRCGCFESSHVYVFTQMTAKLVFGNIVLWVVLHSDGLLL